MKRTYPHIYPLAIDIQIKIEKHWELSAEEELLHYVDLGQFDRKEAQEMLQDWFPGEVLLPIR